MKQADLVGELTRKNNVLQQELDQVRHELDTLKRLLYAPKSERFLAQDIPGQLSLELAGEQQTEAPAESPKETITYEREKKKHVGRHALPDHLPRVQRIIEPEEDTTGMVRIGQEVTELLAKVPSRLYVIQLIRYKYAQPDGSGVIIGKLPARAIEKGMVDESLLADILVSKYVDHQPLDRQAKILAREKVIIPSSTMGDWVGRCCRLLVPLYQALKKEIVLNDYLQVDESPIRVLDQDKPGSTHRGFYWLYHVVGSNLVIFDYRKGRGREGPREMLKNYKGILQTDGYSVYDEFEKNPHITLMGCMAHARRYFDQAKDNDLARATYFLSQVQQLYLLEKTLREQNADWARREELRKIVAVPILESLHAWLKEQRHQVLPKSAIGKAINYSLQRWKKLSVYATHGGLQIDNNAIENQVRPLALGRKNYLFAGSHDAAQNAAIIYSLVGSCKLNNQDPFQYLKAILEILPDYPVNRLAELLPGRVGFK
jgi:transposase